MALEKAVRPSDTQPFKFENRGDTLKGYYMRTSEETINGSLVKKHVFKTQEGLKSVLGQADMYKQLIDNNCLKNYVEVTFTGNVQKLKGGRTMKLYDVSFDDQDTIGTSHDEQIPDTAPSSREESLYLQESDFNSDDLEEVSIPAPSRVTLKPQTVSASQAEDVRRVLNAKGTRS